MCDICRNAQADLAGFLNQLEQKYPGTTVRGEAVDPTHHVDVAVIAEATYRYQRMMQDAAIKAQLAGEQTSPRSEQVGPARPTAGIFGGGRREIRD